MLYASCRIRTCGPLLRRQLLYPAELRKHLFIISDSMAHTIIIIFFKIFLDNRKFCFCLHILYNENDTRIILAKRLSEKQKKIIIKCFIKDRSVDSLAEEFDCTKSTIIRNLKKILGDDKYKELIDKSKKISHSINSEKINHSLEEDNFIKEDFSSISPFTEIAPLNFEIESSVQKDLSSVPIHEVNLPSIVYMIVDKEIELEVKYLKEYPDWQFLAKDELNRKTIAIYSNLKVAKRFCKKEQKVIKVPNSNVFRIVSPLLQARGITRIVSEDQLIAL